MSSWCFLIIGICIGITIAALVLTPVFVCDAVKGDRTIKYLTEDIKSLKNENRRLRERLKVLGHEWKNNK